MNDRYRADRRHGDEHREPKDNGERICAPYNFVPLSNWVFEVPDGKSITIDRPFADGLNGVLTFRLETHTPLLVGGERTAATDKEPGSVQFFRGPDGKPAIPGSSLKGMVRNVLEIATYGKMSLSDDRWLSIRDLAPGLQEAYREQFSDKKLQSKCKAGFLRFKGSGASESGWELTPHRFARVRQKDLVKFASEHMEKDVREIRKENNAYVRYRTWGDQLAVRFHFPREKKAGQRVKNDRGSTPVTPDHEIARLFGYPEPGQSWHDGRLVLTGQPQDSRDGQRVKHLDFIFYEPATPRSVPTKVLQAFLDGHRGTDDWQERWSQERDRDPGIPVFYLEEDDPETGNLDIRAMGLAMLFRLPYRKSIGETIATTNRHHRDPAMMDFAESLFGNINGEETGLKGRVSFSLAKLVKETGEKTIGPLILSEPKPSYVPIYIHQPLAEGHQLSREKAIAKFPKDFEKKKKAPQYHTYMEPDSEIRGWKRYPARPLNMVIEELDNHINAVEENTRGRHNRNQQMSVSFKVQTELNTLNPGTSFEFRLRVHNLRPFELGALLWALSWANQPTLRHGLGMGKPFGLGQVSATMIADSWQGLRRNDGNPYESAEKCIEAFETKMEFYWQEMLTAIRKKGQVSWRDSEPLTQLMGMADPSLAPGKPGRLEYMTLEEYQKYKGPSRNFPRLVLEPYVELTPEQERNSDHRLFPKRGELSYVNGVRAIRHERRSAALKEQHKRETLAKLEQENKPDFLRDLELDLSNSDDESKVKHWIESMTTRPKEEARLIAERLRDFLDHKNKGKKKRKISPRDKRKYQAIRDILDPPQLPKTQKNL